MSQLRRQSISFIVITTALTSCISMLGGLGIEFAEAELLPIVPLVIALPALNTMVGDYATVIAAHAGNENQKKATKRKLVRSIFISTIFNISGTIALSIVLANKRGYHATSSFIALFSIFVCLSVLGIVAIMFAITYFLERILEQKKLNPDDVLIPIVTTITDVFMLGLIAIAAKVLF